MWEITPTSASHTHTLSYGNPAHTHLRPAAHWALLTDGGRARLAQAFVAARPRGKTRCVCGSTQHTMQ